ncbi:hypothetical protein HCZ23_04845 [Celeribacter sp. HF31]|uniref:hypothetical protein n=1 Tax=Celeribacter sp. HF31 TaxID=2721558 RepID=UPI0014304005|nr:hypothetical protein [Celeribacter sp. HF31]NIY78790.1 hypothetical protein [Celeribacter sp. HF31]
MSKAQAAKTAKSKTGKEKSGKAKPATKAATDGKPQKRLFMMLFEATAGAKTGLRMGGRHAIMVFMVASEQRPAIAKAFKGLEATGWSGMEMKKGEDITGRPRLKDKALDASALKAMQKGAAFLVYKDEIKGQA